MNPNNIENTSSSEVLIKVGTVYTDKKASIAKKRVLAKCVDNAYEFKFYAYKHINDRFYLSNFHPHKRNCNKPKISQMKTTSLILNTYTVFSEIKPKNIVKRIQKDFAGDINYKKAFRTLSSLKNKSEKINIETLDGCHLRSSFIGVLFGATALNGDGHNVIIAFGIYPIENNHNRYSSKGSSFSLLAHVERNIGGSIASKIHRDLWDEKNV
ncbi:hypothetical protein BB558_000199 [Smittium angustum]|uniref:Uncharacterized protein n=1 Tax=Smittium angustum TaxID=133377 RepID=A0A2U1JFB7_SMIAN|nr:hypothetical protein BB558_000199 [Smittium angustum]